MQPLDIFIVISGGFSILATLLILSAPAADHVPPLGILLAFLWIASTSVVLTRRALMRQPTRSAAVMQA